VKLLSGMVHVDVEETVAEYVPLATIGIEKCILSLVVILTLPFTVPVMIVIRAGGCG
jgi:hypothetical protein